MKIKLDHKGLKIDKKVWLGLGGLSLVVVLFALIGLIIINSPAKSKKTAIEANAAACKLFNSQKATTLLGSTVKQDTTQPAPASTDDISVGVCNYKQATATISNDKLSAGLTARTPLTPAGVASNQQAFKGPQALRGFTYGKAAFWTAKTGQLNILSHDNVWYSLSFGPLNSSNRSLIQTTQAANLLADKLK